jgi:hypothetical protein
MDFVEFKNFRCLNTLNLFIINIQIELFYYFYSFFQLKTQNIKNL